MSFKCSPVDSKQGLGVSTDFLRPGDQGRPEEASSDSLSAASRSEEPSAQAPACGAAASRNRTPPDSVPQKKKIIKKKRKKKNVFISKDCESFFSRLNKTCEERAEAVLGSPV